MLARCKPGLLLLNASRGENLDEVAVLEALNNGTLGGAAIDAWRKEPPGIDPLVGHSKVIATPHIGGYTLESLHRSVTRTVDLLLDALL